MPSGGNHGGGRPPSLERARRANTKIAQTLKEVVNIELEETALSYREMVQKAIALAKQGNVALLKLFIELPFKSLDFSEMPDNPLDMLREHMAKAGLIHLGTDTQDSD